MVKLGAIGAALAAMLGLAAPPAAAQAASPLPPPPSVAPPPMVNVTHLQPIDPGSWVTNDDYPPDAIRDGLEGTSSFRLDVDEAGNVTACTITGSAGAPVLDDAVCALLRVRARFHPAKDANGKPVPASYLNRFRWELPRPDRVALETWVHDFRITIGADGRIVSCSNLRYPTIPAMPTGCGPFAAADRTVLKDIRGTATGPVTIVMRDEQAVSGMTTPAAPVLGPEFKPITVRHMRMEVEPGGDPAACYTNWGNGEFTLSEAQCKHLAAYEPTSGWHTVTRTGTFSTNGDPNVTAALDALMSANQAP